MTQVENIQLSMSLEDYLEAIFCIIRDKQAVRAKDIGNWLNVGRSSVTGALHALAERELVNYSPYSVITLTDKGKNIAEKIVRRHEILRYFFVRILSIPEAEADEAACKMEHAISDEILQRFVEFIDFVDHRPNGGIKWTKGTGYQCKNISEDQDYSRKTMTPKDTGEENVNDATTMTLKQIKPGENATIIKINNKGNIKRRLLDMGVTAGTTVKIDRVAPLGDPIEVTIKGYHLTLRNNEAEQILVEPIKK